MANKSIKGIYCLEGDWVIDMKKVATIEPALELLKKWPDLYVQYIHRDIGTRHELEHYLTKWTTNKYSDYPILYLAFHGREGNIEFGDKRKPENILYLKDLSELLSNKCKGRIIYFGSCSTLGDHGKRIRKFLNETGALAVCGYRKEIDWLISTAFDLMFFRQAQFNAFTVSGARAIEKKLNEKTRDLKNQLGFHMVINE